VSRGPWAVGRGPWAVGDRGPGPVSHEMLQAFGVARYVAVVERIPHARVDRKPAVLPCEHVVCGPAHKPLHFAHEDLCEGGDGLGPLTEEPSQSLRYEDHPLPDGDWWNDMIDQMRRGLGHA